MPALPKPTEGGSFTLPPEGTFPAICYRVLDLGTQQSSYNGEAKRAHKMLISWELKDEEAVTEDGQPMTVHQQYTWSMHEKSALRRDLESWRGKKFTDDDFFGGAKPFDIRNILGCACLLSIVHATKGEKTYANITSVSKPLRGMDPGALTNPPILIWLDEADFNKEEFANLSERLQEKIKSSPEYHELMRGRPQQSEHIADADAAQAATAGANRHPAFDDSIPFDSEWR